MEHDKTKNEINRRLDIIIEAAQNMKVMIQEQASPFLYIGQMQELEKYICLVRWGFDSLTIGPTSFGPTTGE